MINPTEIFGNDYDSFYETDPFNPRNIVEGYIVEKAQNYMEHY